MNIAHFCSKRVFRGLSASGLTLGALFMAVPIQAGEYYKWVDDKGVAHFSEQPAPGSGAKKVGTATKTTDEATADDSSKDPAEAKAAAAPADNPQNAESCKTARERLKSLQSGQRIRLVGADGKFAYLDENQVKDEITKTQGIIKGACH